MSDALPAEAERFLSAWLEGDWSAEPLAGDVSARAYFRVVGPGGRRCIVAWYPEQLRPDIDRFLNAHQAIAGNARVPAVLRHSEGAVAQEDVGDLTLFQVLESDPRTGVELYRRAIDLLISFQQSPEAARGLNPPFDAAKFRDELEMTREWYVKGLSGEEGEALRPWFDKIAQRLEGHPYVLCHRDYHGQNIHISNDHLYMIDFQDLRMGPDTYDLASLLRDRGVATALGPAEDELIAYYAEARGEGAEDLRRRYFETLLQRSIKTIGTFAKVAQVRGRTHYLDFIPAALQSVHRCVEELPEYSGLLPLLPMRSDK